MSKHHRTQGGKSSRLQLERIYLRDMAVCWICKDHVRRSDASRDHMDLACKSQNHNDDNMRLAHSLCNDARGDTPLTDAQRLEHASYIRFMRGLNLVTQSPHHPRVLRPNFGPDLRPSPVPV